MSIDTTVMDKLKQLELELGDNTDAVKNTLVKLGCKGYTGNAKRCPLARYFQMQTRGIFTATLVISILTTGIEVYKGVIHRGTIQFLPSTRDFVINFDLGRYPELVKETPHDKII